MMRRLATVTMLALLAAAAAAAAEEEPAPIAAWETPATTPDGPIVAPDLEIIWPTAGAILQGDHPSRITWRSEDGEPATGTVDIDYSADAGSRWVAILEGAPNSGRACWTPPALSGGRYLVRVTVRGTGRAQAAVSGCFAVDADAPRTRLLGPRRTGAGRFPLAYEATEDGPAELAVVRIWRWDGGGWKIAAKDLDCSSPVEVNLPAGHHLLAATAQDTVGNETRLPAGPAGAQLELEAIVDETTPRVALRGTFERDVYRPGDVVEINYTAEDDNLGENCVEISYSADGGTEWTTIDRTGPKGTYAWKLPKRTIRSCLVRVAVEDIARNRGVAVTPIAFSLDGGMPEAVVTGPRTTRSRTVELTYRITGRGLSPVTELSIWATPAGKIRWQRLARVDAPRSEDRIEVTLGEGAHLLAASCRTRAGYGDLPPIHDEGSDAGEMAILVDTTRPTVEMLPTTLRAFRRGRGLEVNYIARDEHLLDGDVAIYYSDSDRADWVRIAGGLDAEGPFLWPVPARIGDEIFLKVVATDAAGNSAVAETPHPLVHDDMPPVCLAEELMQLAPGRYAVAVNAIDIGSAGVADVTIWRTPDGRRWEMLTDPTEVTEDLSIQIDLEDGRWGIAARGRDRLGNSAARPTAITDVQRWVTVDTIAPSVRLLTLRGGELLRGGTTREIRWTTSEGKAAAHRITLELSPDGGENWVTFAHDLRNTGSYLWRVPAITVEHARLRVAATDQFGNTGRSTSSADIGIDSSPPIAQVTGPRLSATTELEIDYEASDRGPAGLRSVEIWQWREGDWMLIANDADAVSPVSARLPDGEHMLAAVAVDAAGNRAALPEGAGRLVTIDTTAPRVILATLLGGEVYTAGSTERVIYEVTGSHLPANPVTIEFSKDTGITWERLAEDLPAEGDFEWRLPVVDCGSCRIRVSARNEMGTVGSNVSQENFGIGLLPGMVPAPPPARQPMAKAVLPEAREEAPDEDEPAAPQTDWRTLVDIGANLYIRKQYDAALKRFLAARALTDEAVVDYNLGLTLLALGDLEGAKAALRRAEEKAPDLTDYERVLRTIR